MYKNKLNYFFSLNYYLNGLTFLYKNMISQFIPKNKLLELTKKDKIFVDYYGLFFIVNAHEFDV